MKVALASDERTSLTDFLIGDPEQRDHKVLCFGTIAEGDSEMNWPLCARNAAESVARSDTQEAIVCCWTGTGVSIAANKIVSVRAALCAGAETAKVLACGMTQTSSARYGLRC